MRRVFPRHNLIRCVYITPANRGTISVRNSQEHYHAP